MLKPQRLISTIKIDPIEFPGYVSGNSPTEDTAMKDMLTIILIVFLVIGLWMSLYVFAAVTGAGIAIMVLYHWLKEYKEGIN